MRRALLALLLGSSLLSCGKAAPVGGVMLGVRTDLEVPARVDSVGIYIQRIEGDRITPLAPIERRVTKGADGLGRVYLPGTLAIENPGNPNVRIRVRVVAYDDAGTVLVMRESRVRVPNDRLASLPLPLLWMNTDDVVDANPAAGGPAVDVASGGLDFLQASSGAPVAAFDRFRSDFCGDGFTLDDSGACIGVDIEVDELPDYAPASPEGAGEVPRGDSTANAKRAFCAAGVKASCFDVARCFANDDDPNYQPLEVLTDSIEGLGTSTCSVVLSDAPDMQVPDVALAVRTTEAEGAICVPGGACYIPIDSASGFSIDAAGRRITLPPGVCRKAQKGKVLSIVASPLCDRRQAEEPTCIDQGCLDGSGWNLERDPGAVEVDGGTDGGLVCAQLENATGMWVGDTTITVLGDQVSRFELKQAAGECLTGERSSTAAPSGIASVPYRLLGSAQGDRVAFSSSAMTGGLPAAGTLGVSGPPLAIPLEPNPVGLQGAAFFTALAPPALADTTVFLGYRADVSQAFARQVVVAPSAASTPLPEVAIDGAFGRIEFPSNAVAFADQEVKQAVWFEQRKLALVTCTPTSCALVATPEPVPPVDLRPVYLTASGSVVTLVARGADDSVRIFTAERDGIFQQDGARSFASGGSLLVDDSVPIAITDTIAPVTYLATGRALVSLVGGGQPVVEAPVEGQIRAVQVRGKALYWLQVDEAGRGTVHHRALDANGRIVRQP